MSVQTQPRTGRTTGIDPRGPQFAAALTSAVLVAVLLTPPPVATVLVGGQAVLFALGALGVQRTPYASLFRRVVRPRLTSPAELEDPRPPQFAQAVGLVFATVSFINFLAGATVVGQAAAGLALAAALLNAIFRFCLGCELYLTFGRLRRSRSDRLETCTARPPAG